jgi:hypothetical protein
MGEGNLGGCWLANGSYSDLLVLELKVGENGSEIL